jgi:GTPase SAR1 family protein/Leucine-rich repeat (LRR) protein
MELDKRELELCEESIAASDGTTLDLRGFFRDSDTLVHVLNAITDRLPNIRAWNVSLICDYEGMGLLESLIHHARKLLLSDGTPLLRCLQTLDLDFTASRENMRVLASVVESGYLAHVRELLMLDMEVGEEGLALLFGAARKHRLSELRTLYIAGDEPWTESMRLFGEALQRNELPWLEHLKLSNSQLNDEGATPLTRAALSGCLPCLRDLSLNGNNVTDASMRFLGAAAEVGYVRELRDLKLNQTRVGDESIRLIGNAAARGRLPFLRNLDLSFTSAGKCGLRTLGDAARRGGLSRLGFLNLSRTHMGDEQLILLSSAAADGELPRLRLLDLSNTSIGDEGAIALAQAMQSGQIPHLYRLDLSGTNISDRFLQSLAEAALSQDLELENVDLSHTRIGNEGIQILRTASESDRLTKLKTLTLDHTCVDGIDSAILSQGGNAQHIFEALRNGEFLLEARIILLGSGGVGKTWLRRRLFQNEIVPRFEGRSETHDIEFVDSRASLWKPRIMWKEGMPQSIEPRIWDFAGQLVAHGVHEAFLAADDRTLCLLVLDASRVPTGHHEDNEELGNCLPYWLRTIVHFAGQNVPVVIAITKCDSVDPSNRRIDYALKGAEDPVARSRLRDLKEAFGAHVVRIVDNCSACDKEWSIEPLRRMISWAISQLPGVKQRKLPRSLITLRTKVEDELSHHPFVATSQFMQWCNDSHNQEMSREQTDSYLRIFHFMGSLFYFDLTLQEREEKDREGWRDWLKRYPPGRHFTMRKELGWSLRDRVINPAWLKMAIYRLIRLSKGKAWFCRSEIVEQVAAVDSQLISDGEFAPSCEGGAVVEEFLKLIELAYYDPTVGKYFFPRGLPLGPPPGTDNWDTAILKWDYVTEASFHRFIVRMHERNEVVGERGSYGHWRDAVLIEYPQKSRAAVVCRHEEGILEVRFDPQSDQTLRSLTWNYVRDLFTKEFIGEAPKSEERNDLVAIKGRPAATEKVEDEEQRKAVELDRRRLEQLAACASKELGENLEPRDEEFLRDFVNRTRRHPFPSAEARSGFRAGYFFRNYVRHLPGVPTSKWTWDRIYVFLGRVVRGSKEMPWHVFGDSDRLPTLNSIKKFFTRPEGIRELEAELNAINPRWRFGSGPRDEDTDNTED